MVNDDLRVELGEFTALFGPLAEERRSVTKVASSVRAILLVKHQDSEIGDRRNFSRRLDWPTPT